MDSVFNFVLHLLDPETWFCSSAMRSRELDDHGEDGDDGGDRVGDDQPPHEPGLRVHHLHPVDLPADAVAHQGHQGEGGDDGKLVDQGDHRAGERGHGLLSQVLLDYQGQEGQQEHRGEVQHELVVLRTKERIPESDVDADGDNKTNDGNAEDDGVVDKVLLVPLLLRLVPCE